VLQKIIGIKNVGRFRNSAAQPLPALARHAFIFGPNGFGKTTLCAILRSLERNDPNLILGRRSLGVTDGPQVGLLWSGAPRAFQNNNWPGPEPTLSIFDGTFVAENVHSGDLVDISNRRNLYRIVVGRNGVGLAQREAALAEEGRAVQARLSAAEKALEPLTGGVTSTAFDKLPADPELAGKLATAKAALAAQQQAAAIQARAGLQPLVAPALPAELARTLAKTIEGIDPAIERQVEAHLAKHAMDETGERWLATGTRLVAEGDECPFCDRGGLRGLPIMAGYRTLFGRAYASLRDEVDHLRQQAETQFGNGAFQELRAAAIANVAAREFWSQHCVFTDELPQVAALRDSFASVLAKLEALIGRKEASPLDVLDRDSDISDLTDEVAEVRALVDAYNMAVAQANTLIETTRAQAAAADEAMIRKAIADLERVARRHGAEGVAKCDAWRVAAEAKRNNQTAKAEVRRQLEDHCLQVVKPYEARINHYLRWFNAGFQIADVDHAYPGGTATCTYRLRIDDIDVPLGDGKTGEGDHSFKNTLSAGDRTTLALAFFLAELEREPDIAERVVVFDDPFNSQDAYRRRNTVHEIMGVARKGPQIIVLSHDAGFLKSLWDKSPPAERSAAQLDYHPSIGTKLREFDLDNACQGRAQSELDDLLAYRNANVGAPRDVIKKLRIVLETKLRDLYPASFVPADMLGGMLGKVRDGGADHPAAAWYDELDRINDYTQAHMHGENPVDATEPPIDRQELMGYVEQTLRIANAVVG
jgi:wobble nucleotide-excising tRNase